jgi:hypothetical protein
MQIKTTRFERAGFHALAGKDQFGLPQHAGLALRNRLGASDVALAFGQIQLVVASD